MPRDSDNFAGQDTLLAKLNSIEAPGVVVSADYMVGHEYWPLADKEALCAKLRQLVRSTDFPGDVHGNIVLTWGMDVYCRGTAKMMLYPNSLTNIAGNYRREWVFRYNVIPHMCPHSGLETIYVQPDQIRRLVRHLGLRSFPAEVYEVPNFFGVNRVHLPDIVSFSNRRLPPPCAWCISEGRRQFTAESPIEELLDAYIEIDPRDAESRSVNCEKCSHKLPNINAPFTRDIGKLVKARKLLRRGELW